MSAARAPMDRLLQWAVPRPVPALVPPPHELVPSLWALDRELLHFGVARLPTRTTIIRLADRSLVVVSPPPLLDEPTAAAIDSIGTVTHVVAPNSFHYVYAVDCMARYPDAELLTAPGLAGRVDGLPPATELGPQPPQAWSGEIACAVLGPVRGLSEVLLFHAPTETLILTDVAFNMQRYPRPLDRLVWRSSGIPSGFGPGRTSRTLLLADHAVASRCLHQALEWPFQRIVVAHGDVVSEDARARFRDAFDRYLS